MSETEKPVNADSAQRPCAPQVIGEGSCYGVWLCVWEGGGPRSAGSGWGWGVLGWSEVFHDDNDNDDNNVMNLTNKPAPFHWAA